MQRTKPRQDLLPHVHLLLLPVYPSAVRADQVPPCVRGGLDADPASDGLLLDVAHGARVPHVRDPLQTHTRPTPLA